MRRRPARLSAPRSGFARFRFPPEVITLAVRWYLRFGLSLWVPNWSSTSCDLGIFVYQPAEQIATSKAKLGWRRRRW
jgi:hypothetical protein